MTAIVNDGKKLNLTNASKYGNLFSSMKTKAEKY